MQKQTSEGYRLSPQQAHLWSLQRNGDSSAYRIQCAVLIDGDVDQMNLRAALDEAIEHNESLRTVFQYLPGFTVPLQVVQEGRIHWTEHPEFSGLTLEEQKNEIECLLEAARQRPLDLQQGPLLDASLIYLSQGRRALLLSLPAICADRAGLDNLVSEIARRYHACVQGEEFPGEPVQYADVSEYFNELLESEETETGRDYWRRRCHFDLEAVRIPFLKRPGADARFHPSRWILTIKPEWQVQIETYARQNEISSSTFWLACWQSLVSRLSAEPDVVIGSAFQGREGEGLGGSIGLFERYLPVSCHLGAGLRFREFVQQVEELTADLNGWQEFFSWSLLAKATGKTTEPDFFPVCYEYADGPTSVQIDGVTFSFLSRYACTDRFRIKLSCIRGTESVIAELQYDESSFDPEEVSCLAEQFLTLVESALNDPETPIESLRILSDAALLRLVEQTNNTAVANLQSGYAHERIQQQAARVPDSIAVIAGDRRLSF
jgi:hypothetical protein